MDNENKSSDAIGFAGALFLIFLVLKLTNYVDWSWWMVTAPIWFGLIMFIIGCVAYVILVWVTFRKRKPKNFHEQEGVITHHDVSGKELQFMRKLKKVMEENNQHSELN